MKPRGVPLALALASVGFASAAFFGCARNAEEKQLEAMRDEIDNLREARDRADREAGMPVERDPSLVVPPAYRSSSAPPPRPVPTVVQLGATPDGTELGDVGDPQDTTPRPTIRVQGTMRGAGRNGWRVDEVEETGLDDSSSAAGGGSASGSGGGGAGAGGGAAGGARAGAGGGMAGAAGSTSPAGPSGSSLREGAAIDPEAKRAYDAAIGLVNAKKYDQALDAFARFLVKWPDHPYANNAMFWRGECYFARGEYRQAADQYEGVLARFPSGSKVPDALLKLGMTYQKLGNPAKAKDAFDRLASQFPDSEAAHHIPGARPPEPRP